MHPRNARTAGIDGEHAICIIALQNKALTAKKFAPKLKRHHYGQQFQNVDVVSKLTEDGGGKRGVKVLPCEIATRTRAACVSGEE